MEGNFKKQKTPILLGYMLTNPELHQFLPNMLLSKTLSESEYEYADLIISSTEYRVSDHDVVKSINVLARVQDYKRLKQVLERYTLPPIAQSGLYFDLFCLNDKHPVLYCRGAGLLLSQHSPRGMFSEAIVSYYHQWKWSPDNFRYFPSRHQKSIKTFLLILRKLCKDENSGWFVIYKDLRIKIIQHFIDSEVRVD